MNRLGSRCFLPIALAALFVVLALAPAAFAQTVELSASTNDIYAEAPFVLTVQAQGFAESPEPAASAIEIAGCEVAALGAVPNVSQFVSIMNGRRTERRNVTFSFRYRVTALAPGTFTVPAVTVTQGAVKAATGAAQFQAKELPSTPDMRLVVTPPERAVWVGETFPVTIDWYLRSNPDSPVFVVPLFARDALVEVRAPDDADARRRIAFQNGARDVELPFEQTRVTLDGQEFARFRFEAEATALAPASLTLPAAKVISRLQTGTGRDAFGFPAARYELRKAEGAPSRYEAKAPPTQGRPASFCGVVGTGFSLEVAADRTVVRVGDPITLDIVVRGKGRLDGLTLPPLDADGGLSPSLFGLPDGAPPGERTDDGGKRFRPVVRVRSAQASEIPALALSFFNPVTGAYQTVRSRPIALAVKGGSLVGAEAVVSGANEAGGGAAGTPAVSGSGAGEGASAGTGAGYGAGTSTGAGAGRGAGSATAGARGPAGDALGALVGADLSLSEERRSLREAPEIAQALQLVIGLHVAPLVFLGLVRLRARGAARRRAAKAVRRALARALAEIDAAAAGAIGGAGAGAAAGTAGGARGVAGRMAAALNEMRHEITAGGAPAQDPTGVIVRCEAVAYDPGAASRAPDPALVEAARDLARSWAEGALASLAVSGAGGAGSGSSARGKTEAGRVLPGVVAPMAWLALGTALVLALVLGPVDASRADAGEILLYEDGEPNPHSDAQFTAARVAYARAMDEPDRDRRVGAFQEAATLLEELSTEYPRAPEVTADWGNAALGARDLGRAVLAYRRALALDPGLSRARLNLAWARGRLSSAAPVPGGGGGGADSLLAGVRALPARSRLLFAAGLFAAAALLLVPTGPTARGLRLSAATLALAWAGLLASVLLEPDPRLDAVLLREGVVLRSADSAGAPPVLGRPLPAGAEVRVVEERAPYARVELADGARGWVPASALGRVVMR